MLTTATLLYTLISCVGLTLILMYGSILDRPRNWLTSKFPLVGKLLHCSMCTGFWSGVLHSAAWLTVMCYTLPALPLTSALLLLMLPLASSCSSYIGERVVVLVDETEERVRKQNQNGDN